MYLVPGVRKIIADSGLEDKAKIFIDLLGIKDGVTTSNVGSITEYLEKMTAEEKKLFEEKSGLSWDKCYDQQKYIEEMIREDKNKSSVLDYINKEDPFGSKNK